MQYTSFDRAQTDFIHLQMDLANTSVPSPRSIGIHKKQITTGQHHSFSEHHHRLSDLNTDWLLKIKFQLWI